jgi:amino acid transporter
LIGTIGANRPHARGITVLPLVAATYFMVAGGPYGLEELVSSVGYAGAELALIATPLLWSLPTALMVGELSGAAPVEGGYYAWVRRALGPFWGFQEAWLSLTASVFDMAIYPTLFTLYLARLWPAAGEGLTPILLGVSMMSACAAWNIGGIDRGPFGTLCDHGSRCVRPWRITPRDPANLVASA